MKKYLLAFVMLLFSINIYAQKDVTKFMGIPVDGFKQQMFQKLKEKGFVASELGNGYLEGEFNGEDVYVNAVTNNNKVYRIFIKDKVARNQTDIKIRFNKLCRQFKENPKYITLSEGDDFTISEDEDISYEMTVNKKRYEAGFYQKPQDIDSIAIQNSVDSILKTKYTKEQIENPTDEEYKDQLQFAVLYAFEILYSKSVWFMISEEYGKYYILMFYDNKYNEANGEDL